jgi:hypothetical protein
VGQKDDEDVAELPPLGEVKKEPATELPPLSDKNQDPATELPPLMVPGHGPVPPLPGPLPTAALAAALPPPNLDTDPPKPWFWASTEYLLWWVKNAPIGVPLVTGNNNPNSIAALNEPGTAILLGAGSGQSTSYGPFSGGRITAGAWLDTDHRLGFEASGFLLEERSFAFAASSAGGSAPVISIPLNATQPFPGNPAGETSLNAGGNPNLVLFRDSSQLWGAEGNGLIHLCDADFFHLAALVGFRYLDLLENLSLSDTFFDSKTGGQLIVKDGFGTRNQFYGGQIGARGGVNVGNFTVDVAAKIAVGSNHQVSNIAGDTSVSGGAFGVTNGNAGGVFAQPSNSGRFRRDVFAVVPEAQFQVGYQVGKCLHPFIGYNFLYLSDALRPGIQIDRNINPTQNAFFVPPGTLMGAAAPVPAFHSSEFWAQGINFGVEVRF